MVEEQVLKDLSLDYNLKISNLLDQIDGLKANLINDPDKKSILVLSERVHALFVKLSPKMDDSELREQYQFKIKIGKIPILTQRRYPDLDGNIGITHVISRKYYAIFKEILEFREIHLNRVLERLGLTAVQKTVKARIQ